MFTDSHIRQKIMSYLIRLRHSIFDIFNVLTPRIGGNALHLQLGHGIAPEEIEEVFAHNPRCDNRSIRESVRCIDCHATGSVVRHLGRHVLPQVVEKGESEV